MARLNSIIILIGFICHFCSFVLFLILPIFLWANQLYFGVLSLLLFFSYPPFVLFIAVVLEITLLILNLSQSVLNEWHSTSLIIQEFHTSPFLGSLCPHPVYSPSLASELQIQNIFPPWSPLEKLIPLEFSSFRFPCVHNSSLMLLNKTILFVLSCDFCCFSRSSVCINMLTRSRTLHVMFNIVICSCAVYAFMAGVFFSSNW